MSLEDLVKEVQRKIGRNFLLFQQLEYLLKYIVANGQFSGLSSELENNIAKRRASVNKQTMGQLVGQFIESSNPERDESSTEPDELKEAYFSFDFQLETDTAYYKKEKERLFQIVSDRNELVHHLLSELDLNSPKICREVEKRLDDQADKIRVEVKNVQSIAKALMDGRKEIADYLGSEKGIKEFFLSFIRQDKLVLLLGEIASKVAREDGWTLMNIAGQLVKQHAPEELALLHKRNEYKSLKSLMLKAEVFDFLEETTAKGGTRVLYRLKEGWELSKSLTS